MPRALAIGVVALTLAACAPHDASPSAKPEMRLANAVEFRFVREEPAAGQKPLRNRNDVRPVYVESEVVLSDIDIQSARVITLKTGDPAIEIFFTLPGAAKLQAASRQNFGRTLAIIADGEVVTAVPIRTELNLPSAILVSNFTWSEARDIVNRLERKHV
jgi:preprotein translocase subunit SecD